MLGKLVSDLRGIRRACGLGTAARWLASVFRTLPEALRTRQLLAADAKMGIGPYAVRHDDAKARLVGEGAFSGLREIWVRRVYSRDGFLQIPEQGTVVDLGANMGNFTMLALATQPTARVIAVEAGRHMWERLAKSAELNGRGGSIELCQAFIGSFSSKQDRIATSDEHYMGIPTISEADFLSKYDITRIDFLKCDIEGSEYFLLEEGSCLLDITDRIAIELHAFAGDPKAFLHELERRGFRIRHEQWDGPDCIALAARDRQRSAE
jgi:FkbM family methyltransferase